MNSVEPFIRKKVFEYFFICNFQFFMTLSYLKKQKRLKDEIVKLRDEWRNFTKIILIYISFNEYDVAWYR